MVKVLLLLRLTTILILQSVSLSENRREDGWIIIVVAVRTSDFVACFDESFLSFFFLVCDSRVR